MLLDDWATIDTHSVFFDSLKRDGHHLQFETANPPPAIKYFDEFFYDNIILMAPALKGMLLSQLNCFAFYRIQVSSDNQRAHRVFGGKPQPHGVWRRRS